LALALEPLALLTSLLHRTTLTTDATDELQHCLKLQVVNTSDWCHVFVVHQPDRTRKPFAVNKWMGNPQMRSLSLAAGCWPAPHGVYCEIIVLWWAYLGISGYARQYPTGGCVNPRSLADCLCVGMRGS